jgi:hypothetical protein
MLFRKCCSALGLFPYTRPLRMPRRMKSDRVKSGDRCGRSPLKMILSLKKDSISAMLSLDIYVTSYHLAGRNHVATPHHPADSETCGRCSRKLVCSLSLQRKWARWPCFLFSIKEGTCVINFMLLNILVGKLYRLFWVLKLMVSSLFASCCV